MRISESGCQPHTTLSERCWSSREARPSLIRSAVRESDRARPESLVVRSKLAPPVVQAVVAEITQDAGDGTDGYARRRRTGVYRSIRMPVFDRFTSARQEAVPRGYLIPPG